MTKRRIDHALVALSMTKREQERLLLRHARAQKEADELLGKLTEVTREMANLAHVIDARDKAVSKEVAPN